MSRSPATGLHFERYKDIIGQWRWRLVARNGRRIADSAEGYKNKADCLAGIAAVQKTSGRTRIVEVDEGPHVRV